MDFELKKVLDAVGPNAGLVIRMPLDREMEDVTELRDIASEPQ